MPFTIVQGDIAKMDVDAVVNAANEGLREGGGVCGAIFAGAGAARMRRACDQIGHCPTGSAVLTSGFSLPARLVVHAVGPVWRGGGFGEERLLRQTYRSALSLACAAGARSVAFPLISAGVYGYPQAAALRVATDEIRRFLDARDEGAEEVEVLLVIRDREAFSRFVEGFDAASAHLHAVARAGSDVLSSVPAEGRAAFAPDVEDLPPAPTSVPLQGRGASGRLGADRPVDAFAAPQPAGAPQFAGAPQPVGGFEEPQPFICADSAPAAPDVLGCSDVEDDLRSRLGSLDASFASTVLALIDARGLTDVQVYKRANLSRQVFSRLRRDEGYRPTKQTAVALALALELDLSETADLLGRAGYALGHASVFDVVVEWCIERGRFDVFEVNELLFAFDQPLLGSL